MALILDDIYTRTRKKYQLNLVCGKKGLSHVMNWVYITEDLVSGDFLCGGELVITTGLMQKTDPHWLENFISILISVDCCGLILNTGRYLDTADLTPQLIQLCEDAEFPVFTMPWQIHIFDITRDYYNRIFKETQATNAISNAFLSLIHNDKEAKQSVHILEEYGYQLLTPYTICYLCFSLDPDEAAVSSETSQNRIQHFLHDFLKSYDSAFLCSFLQNYILIFPERDQQECQTILQELERKLTTRIYNLRFFAGIGDQISNLTMLSQGYIQAKAALSMAQYKKQAVFCFQDMGFFQLLLSISDRKVLTNFVQTHLGKLITYDREHDVNFQETLFQYLLSNGSIQKAAASTFCHRNTINYRIHIIEKELQIDLSDAETRFHLLTAFQIKEYIKIMSNTTLEP